MNRQISGLSFRSIRWITVLVAVAVTVCMITSAQAYDGKRKGFVTGAGVGVAPVMRFTVDSVRETGFGFGGHFIVGYGWDEQNIIAFDLIIGLRHSDYYSEIGHRTGKLFSGGMHGDQNITQMFGGITWHHYFRKGAGSPFVLGGLGLCNITTSSLGANSPGIGWMLGGGYTLSGYIHAGLYFTGGESSDTPEQFTHRQLSLLVTYIRF